MAQKPIRRFFFIPFRRNFVRGDNEFPWCDLELHWLVLQTAARKLPAPVASLDAAMMCYYFATKAFPSIPFHAMPTEIDAMQPLKQEAIDAISALPDDADLDDIMYRLYVLDKVRKGRKAAEQGRTTSSEDLKREIETW